MVQHNPLRLPAPDSDAFGNLYRQYAHAMLAYGSGLGFDREAIRDAIHDVFCALYSERRNIGEVRHLKAYLFRSLKNTLLNRHKRDRRSVSIADEYENRFQLTATIVDTLIEDEERAALERSLEKYLSLLTDRQREAIYLRFILEMEYEEIAATLSISPHATRKLVSRALITIRESQPVVLLAFFSEFSGIFIR